MTFNGAKAKIIIKYKGSINELAELISRTLIIPEFYFETNQEYPHIITGNCEALGFSIWLNRAENSFDYILEIETNMSLEESFNDLLCDISPWLARYISELCDIETSCVY